MSTHFKPGDHVEATEDYNSAPRVANGLRGQVLEAQTAFQPSMGGQLLTVRFDGIGRPIRIFSARVRMVAREELFTITEPWELKPGDVVESAPSYTSVPDGRFATMTGLLTVRRQVQVKKEPEPFKLPNSIGSIIQYKYGRHSVRVATLHRPGSWKWLMVNGESVEGFTANSTEALESNSYYSDFVILHDAGAFA